MHDYAQFCDYQRENWIHQQFKSIYVTLQKHRPEKLQYILCIVGIVKYNTACNKTYSTSLQVQQNDVS